MRRLDVFTFVLVSAALVSSSCARSSRGAFPDVIINDFGFSRTVSWTSTSHIRGKALTFSATSETVGPTPTWENPFSTAPPFPVQQAVLVAQAEVGKYVSDPERWHLESITLESFGDEGKWVYIVRWHERGAYGHDSLPIPVLMDGTPIRGVWAN